ncbi:MAG: hypothetical protein WCI50_14600, partial [Actinomycetes bacterium]
MLKTLSRFVTFAAAVASALLLVTPAMPAGAAGSSLSHSGKPTTVADGGTVDLTVTSPLYGAGTATRWLQEKIDPSRVHLTSASQIKAPEGWKVQYSTDGTSFTDVPPSTPEAWGHVEYVRARGSLTSGGIVGGKQAVTTSQSIAAPSAPASSLPNFGSGDGWDTVFTPAGQIINWNHHNRSGTIQCRMVDTGRPCAIGSLGVPGVQTQYRAFQYYNEATQRIWTPVASTSSNMVGFTCVSLTPQGPSLSGCNTVLLATTIQAGDERALSGFTHVGSKIYSFNNFGQVICLDTNGNGGLGTACPNQPYGVASQPWILGGSSLISIGDEVMGMNAQGLICIDARIDRDCGGGQTYPERVAWTGARPGSRDDPIFGWQQVDAKGLISSACFFIYVKGAYVPTATSLHCYDKRGQEVQDQAASRFGAQINQYIYDARGLANIKTPLLVGSKMYFAVTSWPYNGNVAFCFDVSRNGGAGDLCDGWNFPSVVPGGLVYSVNQNPQNPSCLYVATDASGIFTISAVTGSRVTCQQTPPTSVVFGGLTPSLGCSSSVSSWSNFTLTEPDLGLGGGAVSAT